jgi:hypothetical protein
MAADEPNRLPPGTRKRSRLGIASFILGVAALLLAIPYILNYTGVIVLPQGTLLNITNLAMFLAGGMGLSGWGGAGGGRGIAQLVKKNGRKIYSITGLVLGILIMLAACPLIIYSALILVTNIFNR